MDVSQGKLEGDLYAGDTAENDERYQGDNAENLRRGIVFVSDGEELLFRSGIGRYIPLEEDHLQEEGEQTVYYPYYNETVVEVGNPRVDVENMELVAQDVSLRYFAIGDDFFVQSDLEVTAYAPNYLVVDDAVYSIPLMFEDRAKDYREDSFLGLDRRQNGVKVENVSTGQVRAVDEEVVIDLVENNDMNGALPLQSADMDRYDPAKEFAAQVQE